MKQTLVDIDEAQQHLAEWLPRVKEGETFLVCEHNEPVMEIRPANRPAQPNRPRPVGLGKGLIEVPADFNAPDPAMEKLFNAGPVFP